MNFDSLGRNKKGTHFLSCQNLVTKIVQLYVRSIL